MNPSVPELFRIWEGENQSDNNSSSEINVLTALDTSTKYLLAMDTETVNKFQLSTQYTCKQSKEI